MKKLLAVLILLMSTASFAQTKQYVSTVQLTNLSYGMMAELWNPGPNTIYFDSATASNYATVPYAPSAGSPEIGWAISSSKESQCMSFASVGIGTSIPSQAQVIGQPCTPNGMPYGCPSPSNCSIFNYTITASTALIRDWGETSNLHPPSSIPVLPGQGITVWFAFLTGVYPNFNWQSWQGQQSVNFFWHE